VLANSPPDTNGYAVRSQSLMSAQYRNGKVIPIALTSPWYPERESMVTEYSADNIQYLRTIHPAYIDNNKGLLKRWVARRGRAKIRRLERQKKELTDREEDEGSFFHNMLIFTKYRIIHGFRFIFKYVSPAFTWVEEKVLFKLFRTRIIAVAKAQNSEIIHAHTPYRVGIPALYAARKLGLPFVYEMRGMWEETAVGSGRWKSWGPSYRRFRRIETKLLKRADAVICICETLRTEAISRGVDAAKITVVHNAVNPSQGVVAVDRVGSAGGEGSGGVDRGGEDSVDVGDGGAGRDGGSGLLAQVRGELALSEGTVVVGYIGSLRAIEGVEQTVSAVAKLADQGLDVRFFALTSTSGQAELRRHCSEQGIADKSVITGPVPHLEVEAFYQLIDIFVVSRPKTRVTSLVTPLKPFEAMMAGSAVICSDLPALAEIVDDGKTGLLYSVDDTDDLASTISRLAGDSDLRQRLGTAAKNWVESERTWEVVVERGLAAYVIAQAGNPLR